MRIGRRSSWFLSRAALATFAIVVQILSPFVVAAGIAAAANAPPICSVPSGDHRTDRPHDSGGACPICVALAATAAVMASIPPAIPLPRLARIIAPVAVAHTAPDHELATAYRSRAPPIA
ncbi:MAG TPA: DUF2946 family protein [Stellaceae bacterium]